MKKIFLFILFLISLFFISGCGTIKNVNLEMSIDNDNFIKQDETFRLIFSIVNPTEYTFVGNIEYQYNTECLYSSSQNTEDIEVPPSPEKRTLIREFRYRGDGHTWNQEELDNKCKQTPHKITIFLKDKSGITKDTKSTTVTIAD